MFLLLLMCLTRIQHSQSLKSKYKFLKTTDMKKKLDTRFPAARIKKIMQADEEVGKIAMATPVLISKALELFLQSLCDKTYEITLRRGAKTMSSLHL
jgi:histone H3/H4